MQNLYIDESGSMTIQYREQNPYFVIAIVHTEDSKRLKALHARFVRSHIDELREADSAGRMFKNGAFAELKGSALTPKLKRDFVSFFCKNNALDVFYIVINNDALSKERNLYANTARAFNYVLKLALNYFIRHGMLPDEPYSIQLDERNESNDTRHFLKNYLNTELSMAGTISNEISVDYFDSDRNRNIQIADVFANLLYSQLRTGAYTEEFRLMQDSGYLRHIFKFPPS